MSKTDGKLLRVPDPSAVMPVAQKDDFGGPAIGTKPLLEFPLLGRNENAGNRWQLDETLHLVKAAAGDETVYKP